MDDEGKGIKNEPDAVSMKRLDKAARVLFGDKHAAGVDRNQKEDDIPESSVWRFIYFLTRNEQTSRQNMIKREFPQVDLFVHYMMDLGPVYGQKPDGNNFIDCSTEQASRVRAFDQQSEGKFIHFVAFSPYRANTEHGIDFEAAWKPVQDALEKGAWGVKFYPPRDIGHARTTSLFALGRLNNVSFLRCESAFFGVVPPICVSNN